ncbi:protein kinase domain-containing protein [Rhizohabitans arisaemae]|uniref:protein kinase domain-containing protein n=1 Tax=Rhizohabitans arisaemae TaxID=2720610 RepID=UPI0024B0EDF1|nr:protein kinase [Rhizohabitans arisaemae]
MTTRDTGHEGRPLLGGRYRLLERIAAGGMGEVWRAGDELLGRFVAIKLLGRQYLGDEGFRERFRSEARITAGLADPGIAQVYDYGEQDDTAYLVMELVVGEPLSAILARNAPLSPEVTLDIVVQTARALHTAHRSGVIHRDIKPGNLMVTSTGVIKVTDFGIARAVQAAPLTKSGIVLGTAQYVSPEQASGRHLTALTDIYSLGVVAYECLGGRPPFLGENQVAIALQHLNDPPAPLPREIPGSVCDLIMATLAKDPGDRPSSAQELADRAYVLRNSLASASLSTLNVVSDPTTSDAAARVAPRAKDGPARRRRSLVLVTTLGLTVFILGVIMLTALQDRPASEPATQDAWTPRTPTPVTAETAYVTVTSLPMVPARSIRTASPSPSATPSVTGKPSTSPSTTPEPTPTQQPTPTPTAAPIPSITLTPTSTTTQQSGGGEVGRAR